MKKKLVSAVVTVALLSSGFSISASAYSVNTDDLILADLGTRYDYINMFSDGLALARTVGEDGSYEVWEFIDPYGNVVIDASHYLSVSDFSEGLAYFEQDLDGDGKEDYCGYIDKTGEQVFGSPYITIGDDFSDGVAWLYVNDGYTKYRYLVDKEGNTLLTYLAANFTTIGNFHDGLACIKLKTGEKYYIDKEGNIAFSVSQYDYADIEGFHDGLAIVSKIDDGDYFASWFGYIDTTGNVVFSIDVPDGETYRVTNFSDGIALVLAEGNNGFSGDVYYYYNTKGEIVNTLTHPLSGSKLAFGDGTFSYFDGLSVVSTWSYSSGTGTTYVRDYIDTTGATVFTRPDDWESGSHGNSTFSSGVAVFDRNGSIILVRNPLYSEEDIRALNEDFEPEVTTYGQSDITLQAVAVTGDSYNEFQVLVSNPTDTKDVGSFAFVVASRSGTVRMAEYELEPYSSQIISIVEENHFAIDISSAIQYLTDGWKDEINASIIKFESDEEANLYESLIVEEQNTTHISGLFPEQGSLLICQSEPGENWLMEYAGITYKESPYIYPEHDHTLCEN